MVNAGIIVYTIENQRGLKFSSLNYFECALIGEIAFHNHIKEDYLEEEFSKVNDYHFADEEN